MQRRRRSNADASSNRKGVVNISRKMQKKAVFVSDETARAGYIRGCARE